MSLASLKALRGKQLGPSQRIQYMRNGSGPAGNVSGANLNSEWITANGLPSSGATPTTAAVPDRTTAGSMGQGNKVGSEQRFFFDAFDLPYSNVLSGGFYMLVDRLAHNGGLDGTNTGAQSNGAWPALTRFTDGVGVWGAVEIYVALGGTLTTFTVSYTSEAGTAGRTSPATDIGANGRNNVRRVLPFSLQSGDKGVKSIASVTLAATTGTAGNFGMSLFKTLAIWPCNNSGMAISKNGRGVFGPLPSIPDDACLQLLFAGVGAGGATAVGGVCGFFED